MICLSESEFIFMLIRAGLPRLAIAICWSIFWLMKSRMPSGDVCSLWKYRVRAKPDKALKRLVKSSPSS